MPRSPGPSSLARRGRGRACGCALALGPLGSGAQAATGSAEPIAAIALVLLGAAVALLAVLGLLAWQQRQRHGVQALQAERERGERLLGLIDAGLWRTDAQHRLSSWRAAAAGAPPWPADAQGRELWTVFDAASAVALQQRLASQAAFDNLELTRDGEADAAPQRWRLRGLPCHDAAGRFCGHEGSALPLAAPPAPNAAPSTAGDAAESFSYTVSHDLRAPIRVVEGFTKILKEDYGRLLDRVGNDHLDRVLGAAARMNAMIDALLALSRLSAQPVARQTVNLSQLAAYVIEDLRRQHPERRVEVILAPGLQATGDPTLLRVVIENLIGNAWKYSARRHVATIEFGRVAEGGRSAFCVADNGAGFDMRFADRLFGVFQRLHSASDFAGTGIGLASVRRIVQRHGGEIWAEAEPERGARFYFTLPG